MRLCRTYFFFNLPDSAINYSINQYEISPFLTASQAPNDLFTDMGMVRKGFGNEPLKDVTMERMRVEKFEESLCEDCGWVNLVFSLGFLSQYSLWKLSTFRGYKGYLYKSENGMQKVRFFKTELAGSLDLQLDWVASSSCEVIEQPVCTFCLVVLQLAWHFNFWHAWHVFIIWWLAAARSSHESLLLCTILNISSHSLTHYPYMIPT